MQHGDYRLTTVNVIYWMPDYTKLLQEFVWQTHDVYPEFPRIKQFLDHWDKNIEARIHEIYLAHIDPFGKTHYQTGFIIQ